MSVSYPVGQFIHPVTVRLKFYSVTAMFSELNLQNFDSLIDKCRMDFQRQVHVCDNGIVQHFVYLHLM